MTQTLYDAYVARFGVSKPQFRADDMSIDARRYRLYQRAQGCEPFDFDEVMSSVYRPPGEMFIDHCFVEHDGKLFCFHIAGHPDTIGKTDQRIMKLAYEWTGYAVGTGLADLVYQGRLLDKVLGDWNAIATGLCPSIVPFRDGFAMIYYAVGMSGTRLCTAFSDDLVNWEQHPENPVLGPPSWAQEFGACKDTHVLPRDDGAYLIYYVVSPKGGGGAVALASTRDFETFEQCPKPVITMPAFIRGSGGLESPGVVERDGLFHLFVSGGEGMMHMISDDPEDWNMSRGIYRVGPFVAAEMFEWRGEWWLTSTKKEELRRQDRSRGISHHGDYEDEMRNLEGMFLSHISWDGDFPVLEKPEPYL